MHEFESIRPYRDQEVAEVVARLVRDRKLIDAASRLFLPRMAQK
ncbi:MAG: glycerol acyltransferase, partial [Gammaproteobacteria bacterium]